MTDLESFEKKMLDNALLCSKALKAHDLAATAQNYEERLQVLTANLEEIKSGENPLAILIAERCCVIFELDYTTDQAKKDRLSDQLCNLNDAMDYMKLVSDSGKYRQYFISSHPGGIEGLHGRVPNHQCSKLLDAQARALSSGRQAPLTDSEEKLWELRRHNLKTCRKLFQKLQRDALFTP